jgi:hypothetical protein
VRFCLLFGQEKGTRLALRARASREQHKQQKTYIKPTPG